MTVISLPFEIVHCSSFDKDHGPEQLVASSPGNRLWVDNNDRTVPSQDSMQNKVKGWQTVKNPTYPQDLILHLLDGPARISKVQILSHHYKVATRIEVYIGTVKDPNGDEVQAPSSPIDDDQDDMLVEFTRLGYVCLDNNAGTQFRARELKSIKVNADGEYIRFVIRNCHQNRLNTYNQVGLLSLNVSGQPLHYSSSNNAPGTLDHVPHHLHPPLDESSMLSSSTRRTSISSNRSGGNRLSLPGAAEGELHMWISALTQAENEAVQDELYPLAKTYKQLSDKLSRYSSILSSLEYEKREAVDSKDYDEAEKIKMDILEIKQSACMLLKQAGIKITQEGRVITVDSEDNGADILPDSILEPNLDHDATVRPKFDTEDYTLVSFRETQSLQQDQLYDDAIEKWTSFDTQTVSKETQVEESAVANPADVSQYKQNGHSSQALPTPTNDTITSMINNSIPNPSMSKHFPTSLSSAITRKHSLRGGPNTQSPATQKPATELETIPEPLVEAERANYLLPIQVFGEDVVALVLSVKVKYREHGLMQIASSVSATRNAWSQKDASSISDDILDDTDSLSLGDNSEVGKNTRQQALFIKAALMMLQEAIVDSRESIIQLTITIWQDLSDLCDAVPTSVIFGLLERAYSGLLMRTNDSNIRIRQPATQLALDLAEKYNAPPYSLLSLFVCKPDRPIRNHKDARARIELVTAAVRQLLIQPNGLVPLDDLMGFVVTYLNHTHDDVRQTAVELVVCISDQVGFQNISKYIDKNLRVSLAETVKRVVEKQGDAKSSTAADTTAKAKPKKSTNTTTGVKAAAENTAAKKRPTKPEPAPVRKTAATTGRPSGTGSSRATATKATKTNGTATAPSTPTTTTTTTQYTKDAGNENNSCIFCEETNPDFNEDTLITHYYDECPMLTNCPMCHIIVEIPTMNEHIFSDCDQRHLAKQCERCKEAIPVEQWLQHTLKQNCTAITSPEEKRCPFCKVTIEPPTDAGWKAHLLLGEGCLQNPRTIRRNNRQSKSEMLASKTTISVRRKK